MPDGGHKLNAGMNVSAQAMRRVFRESRRVAPLRNDVLSLKEDVAEFKAEADKNFPNGGENFARVRGEVARLQHDKRWSDKTPAEDALDGPGTRAIASK